MPKAADPLKPSLGLLVKLGSIVVHAEEYLEPGGHPLDLRALQSLFKDPEVVEWCAAMTKLAMLPVKRRPS